MPTEQFIQSLGQLNATELGALIEKRHEEDRFLKALFNAARSRERSERQLAREIEMVRAGASVAAS
jgi:hypothetical protein